MQQEKKICIVTTSLGRGGAERSSSLLSIILNNLGYEVHIVSVLKDVNYEYAGTLLNLGLLKEQNDTIIGRFNRFLVFKKYLKKEKFDFIIDNRVRAFVITEYLISRFLYRNFKTIYVTRNRKLDLYFTKSKYFAKKIFKNKNIYVGVSKEITEAIKELFHYKNLITIYNPVDITEFNLLAEKPIDFKEKYILYYGRLDNKQKNLLLLIESYLISKLPSNKVKLLILGEGEDYQMLKNRAKSKSIVFKSYIENPFPYVKNAIFTCLSSNYEGFPRTVIESLSLGIPVVSVDCTGATEIVKNKHNGLIVSKNNPEEFAEAMNKLIFDKELYNICIQNSKESIKHLSMESIAKQWDNLIKNHYE